MPEPVIAIVDNDQSARVGTMDLIEAMGLSPYPNWRDTTFFALGHRERLGLSQVTGDPPGAIGTRDR